MSEEEVIRNYKIRELEEKIRNEKREYLSTLSYYHMVDGHGSGFSVGSGMTHPSDNKFTQEHLMRLYSYELEIYDLKKGGK